MELSTVIAPTPLLHARDGEASQTQPAIRRHSCTAPVARWRFAHLKVHHRFERMRLRGFTGARDEFHLAATVQNLKTLANQSSGVRQQTRRPSRLREASGVKRAMSSPFNNSDPQPRRKLTGNDTKQRASILSSRTLSTASVKLGHPGDVRCMTALPPKAEAYTRGVPTARGGHARLPRSESHGRLALLRVRANTVPPASRAHRKSPEENGDDLRRDPPQVQARRNTVADRGERGLAQQAPARRDREQARGLALSEKQARLAHWRLR
jgi:hypothetical protein